MIIYGLRQNIFSLALPITFALVIQFVLVSSYRGNIFYNYGIGIKNATGEAV